MPAASPWSAPLPLLGGGGEPVDFARTLLSHGVADLPPNVIADDGSSLQTVLRAADRPWLIELTPASRGAARLRTPAGAPVPPAAARVELLAALRHMLRLDEDLSPFYLAAGEDPLLAWVVSGAGRMLRSPTVFEDVVKTICTTNCTWSATERMVGAIVSELGEAVPGLPDRRAFPTPAALAQAPESFYRDRARAGYRGDYLRALAADVAEGRLDLEALLDPALSDEEVAARLLAIAGVGPYAVAHVMMLLGRYRRLILDSWTRPKYRVVSGRPRLTDKGIERSFRRYKQFAGLAFWMTLTEDWIAAEQAESAAP